jgi:hypothetical protein
METSMRKLLKPTRRLFLIGAALIFGLLSPAFAGSMMTMGAGGGNSFPIAGATIDEIFPTSQYFPRAIATELVDTRSTTKYVTSAAGVLSSIAINTLPISNAGMLVEPAATNLILQSRALSTWSPFNAAAVDNQTTAPDGTLTASEVTLSGAGGQISSANITPGVSTQASIYVKQGTQGTQIQFIESGSFGGVTFVWASPSGSYQALANGWYRIWFTDPTTTAHALRLYGQNTGDNFYAWDGMDELGSAPTSDIPTTSATVTRSADSIVIQRTGIGRVVFTFDDGSQQTIFGINTAAQYTIPTNLNRPLITRMTGYAS